MDSNLFVLFPFFEFVYNLVDPVTLLNIYTIAEHIHKKLLNPLTLWMFHFL